jgi:catechol 2,3-dioxygenase-like lactoylglutathione lyase family enzyme
MIDSIDGLLKQYEQGTMTRRELVGALVLLAVPRPAPARTGLFQARTLTHLNIRVKNIARSAAFYRNVFGLPAVRPVVGNAYALDLPAGGLISICELSVGICGVKENPQPGEIDHFGIGIDNFDARRVATALKDAGFEAEIADGPSVFTVDPDGTGVQLSAAKQAFGLPK